MPDTSSILLHMIKFARLTNAYVTSKQSKYNSIIHNVYKHRYLKSLESEDLTLSD